MSEWWESPENKPTEPQQPNEPNEPVVPPTTPTEPPMPTEPTTPTEPTATWNPSPSFDNPPPQPTYQMPPTQWPSQMNGQPMPPKPPKRKSNATTIAIIGLSVLCVLCLLVGAWMIADQTPVGTSDSGTTNTTSSGAGANAPSVNIQDTEVDDGGLSTAEIVQKNLDSTVVINLYTSSTAKYGNFTFNTESESLAGTASGIIMSADGYIITNQHVVINESTGEAYPRIEVGLYNGTTYTATVVGADEDTDLAVIKIDATGLTPATFGSSSNLNLGDRIITIGNSGGLEWSVSQGIISGTKRDVYDQTGYSIQCLQIDAVINPGSSGGPLLNAMGQVVGINSAKIVYEGYENLGFSIPIDEAKTVLDDLTQYGYVTGRVELGIKGYTITQSGYEGFMVYEIADDSSLAGVDIQTYDIITAIDGTKVASRTELRNALSKHKVGETVTLSILRITNQRTGETTTFDINVTLRESKGS